MTPYHRFEYGKYIGIVTAPLITAAFEPDLYKQMFKKWGLDTAD